MHNRILDKALNLFFRYGIRGITMDEIATECGISKKTIYQFYENKDALVDAVVKTKIEESEMNCISSETASENAIHEIFLSIDVVQKMFEEMNPNVIFDLQKHHPKSYDRIQQHKSKFVYSVLKKNMERGISQGLYREDFDLDIIAKLRLETVFLPFRQDLFPVSQYSVGYVEQMLQEQFLYGMATLKGQKLIQKYKRERAKK